jgi:YtcA family
MEIETGGGGMSVASGFRRVTLTAAGSSRWLQAGRRCCAPLVSWRVAIALPVAACSYSPTMDLLGSYFPAWMLCAVIGIVASVIFRQILAAAGINDYVVAPLLTYAALAVSATLLVWLFWFGH